MNNDLTFGQYFHNLRIESKRTLRNFCKENDFDVMIISGIERDLIPPLNDNILLNAYIEALNIEHNSDEYIKFWNLSVKSINYFKLIPEASEFYAALYEMTYYKNKYDEYTQKVVHIREQLEVIKREKQ